MSTSACGVSGSGFPDGYKGLVSRSWMPLPWVSSPRWSGLLWLCMWHFVLYHWNWIAVAPWLRKTFCSVLYPWEYCCTRQYMLFKGTHGASEENVWNIKIARNSCSVFVINIYVLCCSLVTKEETGLLFCILQLLSKVWHGLLYIPHASDAVIRCCSFLLSGGGETLEKNTWNLVFNL